MKNPARAISPAMGISAQGHVFTIKASEVLRSSCHPLWSSSLFSAQKRFKIGSDFIFI